MYEIKFQQDLGELEELLVEYDIPFHRVNNKHLISDITESETEKISNLLDSIAFFLTSHNITIYFFEILNARNYKQDDIINMIEMAVEDSASPVYFYNITRVIVREYAKRMRVFNLDSFSTYNMKGWKEDIKKWIDYIISNSEKSNVHYVNLSNGQKSRELTKMFALLQKEATENGVDFSLYETLNVLETEEEGIVLTDDAMNILDELFLDEYFDTPVEFSVDSNSQLYREEEMAKAVILSVLSNVLKTKTVVIHQNVSPHMTELFSTTVAISPSIKLHHCTGCEHCEE
jgi:hypothetical protein